MTANHKRLMVSILNQFVVLAASAAHPAVAPARAWFLDWVQLFSSFGNAHA
jgi:hypothetical protein